jgi:hypothetical protein
LDLDYVRGGRDDRLSAGVVDGVRGRAAAQHNVRDEYTGRDPAAGLAYRDIHAPRDPSADRARRYGDVHCHSIDTSRHEYSHDDRNDGAHRHANRFFDPGTNCDCNRDKYAKSYPDRGIDRHSNKCSEYDHSHGNNDASSHHHPNDHNYSNGDNHSNRDNASHTSTNSYDGCQRDSYPVADVDDPSHLDIIGHVVAHGFRDIVPYSGWEYKPDEYSNFGSDIYRHRDIRGGAHRDSHAHSKPDCVAIVNADEHPDAWPDADNTRSDAGHLDNLYWSATPSRPIVAAAAI